MAASDVSMLAAKLDATQSDLALARGKIEKLDERLGKLERWLIGLAIAAGIMGLAGAFGWNIVSAARSELSELTTRIQTERTAVDRLVARVQGDLANTADAAIREALQRSDVGGRLIRVEGRLAAVGTEERPADASARFGGQSATPMDAICPAGHVAKGLKMLAGGTCGGSCNSDGRPISFFQLICVKQ
ncbi:MULTISPECIES: hypothetical protein [unclassified Variovorax]|uniref:hypothetical protein n=1 Tax=unclassified Variovorax TaxID=663243 RepID=UPI003ED0DF55